MKKIHKKGIIRNKFELLILEKQKIHHLQSRFKPNHMNLNPEIKDINTNLNNQLLESSPNKSIQMSQITQLQPQWLQKYNKCTKILTQITQIKKQVSTLNTKRLNTIRQKQQIEIDKMIFAKATQATKKIHLCDKLLKQITTDQKSQNDQRVCQNMCKSLAIQIQQKTRQLRNQQRGYVQQRKKLANSTKVTFLELAVDKALDDNNFNDQMYQNQQYMEDLKLDQRNSQILKIVQSINELSQIYRQLGNLVLIQGTLLDRIDFNIDQTVKHVKKGNEHLGKALQHQKSPLACRCIIGLILFIFILGIVLGIKHSRGK